MSRTLCLISQGRPTLAALLMAPSENGREVIVDLNGSAFHLEAADVIQLPGRNLANLSFETSRA